MRDTALLDFDKLRQTPANPEPFPHLIASGLLADDDLAAIRQSFPDLPGPGSFPTETLAIERAFGELLVELKSPQMAEILEQKLQVALTPFPTMVTVRGHCRQTDGRIHADSVEKIATVLLYLNDSSWKEAGGRLQLLESPESLASAFTEVEPAGGTMVAFRCDRNAWHGHEPYAGPRRSLQLNWVSSRSWLVKEHLRHRLSSAAKRFRRWLSPSKKPAITIPTS